MVVLLAMGVTAKVVAHQRLASAVANFYVGMVFDMELAVAITRM